MNAMCKKILRIEHEKDVKPQRGMKEPDLSNQVADALILAGKITEDERTCVKRRMFAILGRYKKKKTLSVRESTTKREYWIKKGNNSNIPNLDEIESCPPGAIAAGLVAPAKGAAPAKALTKEQIVDSIAKHTELTETDVEKVLDSLVKHIHFAVSPKGPGKFSLSRLLIATVIRQNGEEPEVKIRALKRLNDMAKTNLKLKKK